MKSNIQVFIILSTIFFILSCSKETLEINPHDGVLNIDCRNLIVRKVTYSMNNKIIVSIENICTTNCERNVYTGVLMIDRYKNDTLALTDIGLSNLTSPENNTTQDYELGTSLTSLPDLTDVKFAMARVCEDITYRPN